MTAKNFKIAGEVAHAWIYGEIGESFFDTPTVRAKPFIDELLELADTVKSIIVHVNSGGGNVFEAVAIANALRAQRDENKRRVEVRIEGLAASAASIVSSAGSPIRIADNALVMVHNPSALTFGNAGDHREVAEALDKIRDVIVTTYRWTSSKSEAELIAMMGAETWMDADEAIANGFATEKIGAAVDEPEEQDAPVATFHPKVIARLRAPRAYRERLDALNPSRTAAAADVIRVCGEAGLDLPFAQQLVTQRLSMRDVSARVATERAGRQASELRAQEIRALCKSAGLPSLADGYIAGAIPLDGVRAHLTEITARKDLYLGEIDGSLLPTGRNDGQRPAVLPPASEIYAARNR